MNTILIIDDESAIRRMLRLALTGFGHQVETAANGREGIELFDSGQYDVVITDILMPGTNGTTVVKHIRRSDKNHVPVIGISGTPYLVNNNRFDAVLTKPFSIYDLDDRIRQVCPDAAQAVSC